MTDKSLIPPDSLRVSVSIYSTQEPEGGGSIPFGTERAKILARRNRPSAQPAPMIYPGEGRKNALARHQIVDIERVGFSGVISGVRRAPDAAASALARVVASGGMVEQTTGWRSQRNGWAERICS